MPLKNTFSTAPKPAQGALMEAVMGNNPAAVEDLLQRGADVNEERGAGKTALLTAIEWVHVEIIRLLLDYGADVNKKNVFGRTALMEASYRRGCEEIMHWLIDKGADVNEKDDAGETAAEMAIRAGYPERAQMLHEAAEAPARAAAEKERVQHATVEEKQTLLCNRAKKIKLKFQL